MTSCMDAICKEAKKLNIPLEINVLGYRRNAQYPSDILYECAAKNDNDLCIGLDIHNPKDFGDMKPAYECIEYATSFGNRVYSDFTPFEGKLKCGSYLFKK